MRIDKSGDKHEEDRAPTDEQTAIMTAICDSCPVIMLCAKYALSANYKHGVDGGFYAGVYMPWKSYYRDRNPHEETRTKAKELLRQRLKTGVK